MRYFRRIFNSVFNNKIRAIFQNSEIAHNFPLIFSALILELIIFAKKRKNAKFYIFSVFFRHS